MSIEINANETVKYTTLHDVANLAGCNIVVASRVLAGKRKANDETKRKVIEAAETLHYKSLEERKQEAVRREELEYLRTHNFPSKEAQTLRMTYLREQGYSNKEIAQKIGCCALTVRRRIGSQEPDMSLANRVWGQKNRAARNAYRRQYVADHTVLQYNELVKRADELKAETKRVEAKIIEIKPKAVNAAKTSKLVMNVPLSEMTATAVQ